jgi:outer membrane immunogenic protein
MIEMSFVVWRQRHTTRLRRIHCVPVQARCGRDQRHQTRFELIAGIAYRREALNKSIFEFKARALMLMSQCLRSRVAAVVLAGVTASLAVTSFGSAIAADIPAPNYKAPAPVAYNWTGCYVGVHAGGGLLQADFVTAAASDQGGGGLAGGQAGCNYQTGQFVFGVEGEGAWSGITNRSNDSLTDGSSSFLTTVRNRWDADLSLRVGYALDRALIYGKAGAALGSFDFSNVNTNPFSDRGQSTLTGLLLGLGLEYGFAPNWSAKLEYNVIDFADKDVRFDESDTHGVPVLATESARKQIVKAGVNYRFGN